MVENDSQNMSFHSHISQTMGQILDNDYQQSFSENVNSVYIKKLIANEILTYLQLDVKNMGYVFQAFNI